MNAMAIDATGLFGPESVALRLLFGVTVLMLAALSAVIVLRRQSAALRHRILGVNLAALLVLPVLFAVLPAWELGWIVAGEKAAPVRSARWPSVSMHRDHSEPRVARSRATPESGADVARAEVLPAERGGAKSGAPVPARESTRRYEATAPTESHRSGWVLRVSASVVWLAVWLVGVLAGLGQMWRSVRATRRLVARAVVVEEEHCLGHAARLARDFGLRGTPAVLESGATVSPLCAGWRRVRIILPRHWRHWLDDHLRAALAHELAHAARRDVAWQLVARLACAVFWFHPLVWLAAWRMRVEREAACDDCVLGSGEPPTQYARLLVTLAAELVEQERAVATTAVAMAAGCRLERRIRALLRSGQRRAPVGRGAGYGLTCAAACLVLVVAALDPFGARRQAAEAAPVAAERVDGTTNGHGDDSDEPDRAETLAIVGRVVDEDGTGVEGAEIETLVIARHAQPPVRSGADGTFRIEVLAERLPSLKLRASHGGDSMQAFRRLPDRSDPRQPLDPVELVLRPAREIPVEVKDRGGAPVPDAWAAAVVWHIKTAEALTDRSGRAVLRVPADAPLQYVLAVQPGTGLDYFMYRRPDEPASDPYKLAPDHAEPLSFTLRGTRRLRVRVQDSDDRPMAGVLVYPWYYQLPKKGGDLNIAGLDEFHALTDNNGVTTFDMTPIENTGRVTFWAQAEGYFAPERHMFDPASDTSEINATLVRLVSVVGRVLLPDGRPAEDIEVYAAGEGYQFDGFRGSVRTPEDGTFELRVNPDQYYLIGAGNDQWAAAPQKMVVRADTPVGGLEFRLQKAARVHGTVTIGADRKPMAGRYLILYQRDDENSYYELPEEERLPNPTDSRRSISPIYGRNAYTDAQGQFQFFVGPGEYYIIGPRSSEVPQFTVANEESLEVDLHAKGPDVVPITGRVVLASDPDRGVPEAQVTGVPMQFRFRRLEAVSGADGRFKAERGFCGMVVFAATPEKKLAGIVTIDFDARSAVIPIGPTASARGKLVDATGAPLADRTIEYGVLMTLTGGTFSRRFGGKTTTGEDGTFTAEGLVVGTEYVLEVATAFDGDGNPRSWRRGGTMTPREPGVLELGEIVFKENRSSSE